jgi:nucleoside-diphosphate-sugar epimerase
MPLHDRSLITGATGCIGGRLLERLVLQHGVRPRALLRSYRQASRIARFDVEIVSGDAGDPASLERAVAGCDVVYHCAHDFDDSRRNLVGVRALAEACLRHRVRRLVYVSSISAYEPLADGDLDESTVSRPNGAEYHDTKLEAERILLEQASAAGLPVAIVQPTVVYGPFSKPWTLTPVRRLRSARLVLPGTGEGLCNAVYVDDVVDALVLAATNERALGQRFLVTGPSTITWREFYAHYQRMIGDGAIVFMPPHQIRALNGAPPLGQRVRTLAADPRRLMDLTSVRAVYNLFRTAIGEPLKKRAKQALPRPLYVPDEGRLRFYEARTRVRDDKARRLLGYQPRIDIERGMDLTGRFVQWANL